MYVQVRIDEDDVIEELSDSALLAECKRRKLSGADPDYSIPATVAKYTLDEAAEIFRKTGRYDLAYKLDEIKVDFIGH